MFFLELSLGDESSVTSTIVGDLGTDKDEHERLLPDLTRNLLFMVVLDGILCDSLLVNEETGVCADARSARDTQTAREDTIARMRMLESWPQSVQYLSSA